MPRTNRQSAALPLRDGLVCLVTSRNGRRWVLPKGNVEAGHTPDQAAANEAWEEAGLVGTMEPEPLGAYRYAKNDRDHLVSVFVMHVADEQVEWPEKPQRVREWMTPDEAAARVEEPGLQAILMLLVPTAVASG